MFILQYDYLVSANRSYTKKPGQCRVKDLSLEVCIFTCIEYISPGTALRILAVWWCISGSG
jgi:hypothetical protein